MKVRAKEIELLDIRINAAGRPNRCELGSTLALYLDGVLYHFDTRKDVDEIPKQHLIVETPVQPLLLKAEE
jgi:(2Fe-2S) ferredoxin